MSYGRIKRSRSKIANAINRATGAKKLTIQVFISRAKDSDGPFIGYNARACFRARRQVLGAGCGYYRYGRTPQSAVAKALKSLTSAIAKRRGDRR